MMIHDTRIEDTLARSYLDGETILTPIGRVVLQRERAGDLHITSGHMIACNPWAPQTTDALYTPILAGTYPVFVSVATINDLTNFVAYATIQIRQGLPQRWAVSRFTDEHGLPDDEDLSVFFVDSGLACLMDTDAIEPLLHRLRDPLQENRTLPLTETETGHEVMHGLERTAGRWTSLSLTPETEANIVIFQAANRNGAYRSYLGYDVDDNILCLTVDLGMLGTGD